MKATLKGGRRPVEADVRRRAYISGGYEGEVFASQVSVGPRKVYMAEKVFRKLEGAQPSVFGDPVAQFKMVKGLIELNKRERLGLRLPRTVRLAEKKNGEKTLLLTPQPVAQLEPGDRAAERSFLADRSRQMRILGDNGYSMQLDDAFLPVMQPDGSVAAVLCDFGNLRKMRLDRRTGRYV